MNDVVFVMANSKLGKKKQARTPNDYNIDDLESDDEWLVDNNNEAELDEDIGVEENFVEVGDEIGSHGGVPVDDLEIPTLDDDLDEGGRGMDGEGSGAHMEEDVDEYDD